MSAFDTVVKCPRCRGRRMLFSIGWGPNGGRLIDYPCDLCLQTGSVTRQLLDQYFEDIRSGESNRQARIASGRSRAQEAAINGSTEERQALIENGMWRAPKPSNVSAPGPDREGPVKL